MMKPQIKINQPVTKRGRPRKNKNYFSEETQLAIINYNQIQDSYERDLLYKQLIHPALNKLTENLINTYKFYSFETTYEDLKNDTITFLHDILIKFTTDRGRAFSFLTLCALNYLKMHSNKMRSKQKFISDMDIIDQKRDLNHEYFEENRKDDLNNFITEWIEWNYTNIYTLYKIKEQKVVDAVLTLFKSSHDLECFNKKYLYILIREQTNLSTSQITTSINKMKMIFTVMYSEYRQGGYIWKPCKSYKKWKEIHYERFHRNKII